MFLGKSRQRRRVPCASGSAGFSFRLLSASGARAGSPAGAGPAVDCGDDSTCGFVVCGVSGTEADISATAKFAFGGGAVWLKAPRLEPMSKRIKSTTTGRMGNDRQDWCSTAFTILKRDTVASGLATI